MTTIAFDGLTVAADTLHTANGCRDMHEPKLWRVRNLIVGACGSTALILRFRQWVADGMEDESPFFEDGDGNGLVIPPIGPGLCFGKHGSWPVRGPYAIGSGEDFARAAMACGKTAEEAVRIAAQFDTSTGGEITVLHRTPTPIISLASIRERIRPGVHLNKSEIAAYG